MKKKYNHLFISLGVTHHNKLTIISASNTFCLVFQQKKFDHLFKVITLPTMNRINIALKLLNLPVNIPFLYFAEIICINSALELLNLPPFAHIF